MLTQPMWRIVSAGLVLLAAAAAAFREPCLQNTIDSGAVWTDEVERSVHGRVNPMHRQVGSCRPDFNRDRNRSRDPG